MYIYQEINEYDFVRAFDEESRADNFSIPARRALFDWYTELAADTHVPWELDVIAVCCDWSELDEGELFAEYGGGEEYLPDLLANLEDETTVIVVEQWDDDDDTYLLMEF